MRIAFLTARDPQDQKSWSGTYYSMAKALTREFGDVQFLGPVRSDVDWIIKYVHRLVRRCSGKNYNGMHSLLMAKAYASIFKKKILGNNFDVIFSPSASTEIALLNTDIPIVYLCDATFALVNNYYPAFSNLSSLSIWEGNFVEKAAIQKAKIVICSSEWAAQSAVRDYGANTKKVHVVPFGANLDANSLPAEPFFKQVRSDLCRLLFLGVEWDRKGGQIAFETLLQLEKMGLTSRLTVCGCIPPTNYSHPNMEVIPSLDKTITKERNQLIQLLISSDFLLVPSRAECSPVAFCEANAFGLPVISTDTGGISSIIENGKNGFLLPMSARGVDYAEIIFKVFKDRDGYCALSNAARETYKRKLNWDSWAKAVRELIEGL